VGAPVSEERAAEFAALMAEGAEFPVVGDPITFVSPTRAWERQSSDW
jgi:hypothetical protein